MNTEFEGGLVSLTKCSLKVELDKFCDLDSNLFHSTMVHGKNDDLKLSVLN